MFSIVVCAFLLYALMDDCHDIRTVQELSGHNEVNTTMVYCSGRQGLNLAGESPVIPIARFGYVAIPQFV